MVCILFLLFCLVIGWDCMQNTLVCRDIFQIDFHFKQTLIYTPIYLQNCVTFKLVIFIYTFFSLLFYVWIFSMFLCWEDVILIFPWGINKVLFILSYLEFCVHLCSLSSKELSKRSNTCTNIFVHLASFYVWEIMHSTIKKMSRHVDQLQQEVDNAHDKQEAAKRKVCTRIRHLCYTGSDVVVLYSSLRDMIFLWLEVLLLSFN